MEAPTTVEEVQASLSRTAAAEDDLLSQLRASLMAKAQQSEELGKRAQDLRQALPQLGEVYEGVGRLETRIAETRSVADDVSKRVREIDLARSRALEALGKVRVATELRICLRGVNESMARDDLEGASEFVARFHERLRQHASPDILVNEGQASTDFSACEESLSRAASEALARAIEQGDDEGILRSCRVFSKLGHAEIGVSRLLQHRSEELRSDVEMKLKLTENREGRDEDGRPEYGQEEHDEGDMGEPLNVPLTYLDLLVHLLNEAAAIIQRTCTLVKRHVSKSSKLQALVVRSIHSVSDALISEILRSFMEKRRLEERIRILLDDPGRLGEAMNLGRARWIDSDSQKRQTEAIHTLDSFLFDSALMLKHTDTYSKFIQSHCEQLNISDPESKEYSNSVEELAGYYTALEENYMYAAIETALEVESTMVRYDRESSDIEPKQIVVSSLAEDAFFVVDKCRDRATVTGHVDSLCAVVNNIAHVLADRVAATFDNRISAIRTDASSLSAQGQEQLEKFRAAYSQAQQALSSPSKSGRRGADNGQEEADSQVLAPETTMNSLNLCISNTSKLRETLEQFSETVEDTRRKRNLKECIDGFLETGETFQRLLSRGLDRLVRIGKPAIQAKLNGTVGSNTISFALTEEEFLSQNDVNESYVWALLQTVEEVLHETCMNLDYNASQQVGMKFAAALAESLKESIKHKQFTAFGGLLLDRQLRVIVKFFESRFGSAVRSQFAYLQQITDILNLDRVEDVHDVFGLSQSPSSSTVQSSTSVLDKKEVKRVLALRTDFKKEDINRLRL